MKFGEKKDIYIVLKYCPTRYLLHQILQWRNLAHTTTAKVTKATYDQYQNKPASCISPGTLWRTQYHFWDIS